MVQRHPDHVVGFIVPRHGQAVVDLDQETDIEMDVARVTMHGRDRVDIDIEDAAIHQANRFRRDARLLVRLTQRNAQNVCVTVCMPARLKPLVMLAMVHQQGLVTRRIDNPGRVAGVDAGQLDVFHHRGHESVLPVRNRVRLGLDGVLEGQLGDGLEDLGLAAGGPALGEQLRGARKAQRETRKDLSGVALARELSQYSERREDYVTEVRNLIIGNDLESPAAESGALNGGADGS